MSHVSENDWRSDLQTHRDEKDEFLREHPHSPLPEGEREGFEGLDYFDPDPAYRFELDLQEADEKETLTVETTTDGVREYVAWGVFRFDLDEEEHTLRAFRNAGDDEDEGFWLPFRDGTSGEETYGAGRYVDLDADEDRTDDGRWVVDFNRAYNPFCAYSAAYECPLVPASNWLETRIEAGEKTYEGSESHRG
ncbi:DUF1684 domain-containing protein [Halobium salinum]|uniref:DUF1684 domain-containing protein n=1 Tax=Halobium salinum TaxID=1364940 RepID=A0ABD5PDA4_9EURY|nr:DUF1684 domain-containing protein [Halobium salinum]